MISSIRPAGRAAENKQAFRHRSPSSYLGEKLLIQSQRKACVSQTAVSVRARRKGCVSEATVPLHHRCLMGFAAVPVSLTKGIISSSKIAAAIALDYHSYNSVAICIK